MTDRKPPNTTFESWVDKQIRESIERGEFDNLPGAGKPIPGADRPDDENWWLRSYLNRQGVGTDSMLPTSLLLRRDLERLPKTVRALATEQHVRDAVTELNDRIVAWLRMPHGPYVQVAPVDADDVVAQWRSDRAAAKPAVPQPATAPTRGRWRSMFGR